MSMKQTQNVPILRFAEFKGEWEEKQLGKIAHFTKGKGISKSDIDIDGNTECIRYGELYTHYREVIDNIISRTNIEKSELIFSKKNDVIIPASGETQLDIATAACVLKNDVALSGDLNIIRTKENGVFVSYYLNNTRKKDIARLSQGVSVVHLYSSQLKKLKLNIPLKLEQKKIAAFLGAVDEKIGQLNRKKALLEEYKKGMMQQLFSQQIRFTQDNGNTFPDWKKTKLGELGECISGLTYSPNDLVDKGLLVLRSSNIQNGELTFDDNKFVNIQVQDKSISKVGDILICVRNGSKRLIGKNTLITDKCPRSTHGAFMTIFRGNNNHFVSQLLQTTAYYKQVHMNLGATINSINGSDLKKFSFLIPSDKKERQIIANFLGAIDQKINAVSSQLTHAKDFKKGLLQQMFV